MSQYRLTKADRLRTKEQDEMSVIALLIFTVFMTRDAKSPKVATRYTHQA